jgi:hypothetical protein
MASEAVLKELFQVAKGSSSFKGISDAEVWKACQAYSNRPDEHIQIAMENIRKKDADIEAQSREKRQQLERGKEKVMALHEKEAGDRHRDELNADKILADLFRK